MEKQDLKELQEAYALLQESNEKLYSSMKALQIAAEENGSLVFTYDTRNQTVFSDEKTARAYGLETVQTGVPYEMVTRGIISEDTVKEYLRIHEAMINGAKEAGGIVKLIPSGGTETIYELKFRAILDEHGEPTGNAVGVYKDITQRYLKDIEQERYQQIVHSSERSTFQYDMDTDRMTLYVSAAREELSEQELVYEDFSVQVRRGERCPESDMAIWC